MSQERVIFFNEGANYAEKKMVFKRQVYDSIRRIERQSSAGGALCEISNQSALRLLQVGFVDFPKERSCIAAGIKLELQFDIRP